MKRFALILIALLVAAPFFASAQQVVERYDFSHMRGWRVGTGDWTVQNERLFQNDDEAGMARIDKKIPETGVYQVDFVIRYEGGGYENQQAYENRRFHAGFGVHVGASNPPLGKKAWGNDDSVLLWLNLDSRADTRENAPVHYGFRAQVYDSESNVDMDLYESPAVAEMLGSSTMSIDLVEALRRYGVEDIGFSDLAPYLQRDVPISIRVNTNTGRIGVKDPTAPIRFYFRVDPEKLQGNYISLRTNDLAVSFDDFTVTQR